MANLALVGFDDGVWGDLSGLSSSAVGSSYGLHGDGARVGYTTGYGFTVDGAFASGAKHTLGFNCKLVSEAGSNAALIQFVSPYGYIELQYDDSNSRLAFQYNYTITLNTTLYTTAGTMPEGVWKFVEIQLDTSTGSAGTLDIWINGTNVGSWTGLDFYVNSDRAQFGGSNVGNYDDWYVDDLYLNDTSGSINTGNIGPIEVVTAFPTGNGNSSDLLGSDGNSTDNYLLVDENPPNETDYVGSATEGDKDTYAFDSLTGTPDVLAVSVSIHAERSASAARFMRPLVRSGTTDYAGDSFGLGETYGTYTHIWDADPDTAAAWTYTGYNAAEFGAEVRDE